jgi:hypothetical protein
VPIDWDAQVRALASLAGEPWMSGLELPLRALAAHPGRLDVAAIDSLLAAPAGVRFEPQTSKRKRGEPFAYDASYDGSITRRGVVPTREGSMHDLMNAVIWSVYPATKRRIHARQDAALVREVAAGQTALPGRRSRLRDRLSMLDEGGVIVWARGDEDAIDEALVRGDLDALRAHAARGTLGARVLGHAILEHASSQDPRAVRGCVVRIDVVEGESLDRALVRALDRDDDALEPWIARLPSLALGALFV